MEIKIEKSILFDVELESKRESRMLGVIIYRITLIGDVLGTEVSVSFRIYEIDGEIAVRKDHWSTPVECDDDSTEIAEGYFVATKKLYEIVEKFKNSNFTN